MEINAAILLQDQSIDRSAAQQRNVTQRVRYSTSTVW
jgi:hypothetical protein